ncbi:hypothetical protein [Natronoglycomyces albus]|uniref:Uncharacterized protein n=1 Tax=Natronoglycomyces albus TaxID=2811108 RepID=A0A895XLS1_9ACTN|nr:hypothetical protein [Natronoglycomyces albus]QSB06037.1 hypothetical protein JQS30_03690 [Natronoglycomyces albus]
MEVLRSFLRCLFSRSPPRGQPTEDVAEVDGFAELVAVAAARNAGVG